MKHLSINEFIDLFDKDGCVVLLEGKRSVLEEDKPKLIKLGKLLADRTKHMRFRSGNASGADELFSKGVVSIDKSKLEVIVPYSGHRSKSNLAEKTISLDDIDLLQEPEVIYHSKKNKKTEKLVDRYVGGDRDKYSIKAAYIIRDTVKVIGTSGSTKVSVGVFYDDISNPKSGGTGHTMNICDELNVPVFDQRTWFSWLKENK